MLIDPKNYGLSSKTVCEKIDDEHIAIFLDRKSRIIMADGKKILEKARKIRKKSPRTKVSFKTNAPICSKTRNLLAQNDIMILEL